MSEHERDAAQAPAAKKPRTDQQQQRYAGLLVPVSASSRTVTISVPLGESSLGRGDSCEHIIADQRISRTHARLNVSDGCISITCVSNSNPIGVLHSDSADWVRCSMGDAVKLAPGCVIALLCPSGEARYDYLFRYQQHDALSFPCALTAAQTHLSSCTDDAQATQDLLQPEAEATRIAELESQLAAYKDAAAEAAAALQTQIDAAQSDSVPLPAKLHASQKSADEITGLKHELEIVTTNMASLQTQLSASQKDAATQQDTITQLKQTIQATATSQPLNNSSQMFSPCAKQQTSGISAQTCLKRDNKDGVVVPLVAADASIDQLRQALNNQFILNAREVDRHKTAVKRQHTMVGDLEDALVAAVEAAKPVSDQLVKETIKGLQAGWEEFEMSFEAPDDWDCGDCDQRRYEGYCDCYKEHGDDYANSSTVTAAVEQVVAGVETDINDNKWNDAIIRLTALCDWIASIDNSSTEGRAFDDCDSACMASGKWEELLSIIPSNLLEPMKSAILAELDKWSRSFAAQKFAVIAGFIQTPWDAAQLKQVLETGNGTLVEDPAVTEFRLKYLESNKRFNEMSNLATFTGNRQYEFRSLLLLQRPAALVDQIAATTSSTANRQIDYSALVVLQLGSPPTAVIPSVACCAVLGSKATCAGCPVTMEKAITFFLQHLSQVSVEDVRWYDDHKSELCQLDTAGTLGSICAHAKTCSVSPHTHSSGSVVYSCLKLCIQVLIECAGSLSRGPMQRSDQPIVDQLKRVATQLLDVNSAPSQVLLSLHDAGWSAARAHMEHDKQQRWTDLPLILQSLLKLKISGVGRYKATVQAVLQNVTQPRKLLDLTKQISTQQTSEDEIACPISLGCLELHKKGDTAVPKELVELLLALHCRVSARNKELIVARLVECALSDFVPKTYGSYYSHQQATQAKPRSRLDVATLTLFCKWCDNHKDNTSVKDVLTMAERWVRDSSSDPVATAFYSEAAIGEGSSGSIAALVKLIKESPPSYAVPTIQVHGSHGGDPSGVVAKEANEASDKLIVQLTSNMDSMVKTAFRITANSVSLQPHASQLLCLVAAEPERMLQQLLADPRLTPNSVCSVGHQAWGTLCRKCNSPQHNLFLLTSIIWRVAHTLGQPAVARKQYDKSIAAAKAPLQRSLPNLRQGCPRVSVILERLLATTKRKCTPAPKPVHNNPNNVIVIDD